MPVRIRLATKGAARNERMSRSMASASSHFLDRGEQQVQIVGEELDVVRDLLLAADQRRHDQHLAAGLAGDRVGCLEVEIRLDELQLHVLPLHLGDQLQGMAGGGWYAGTRLDVADDVQAETPGEVRPRTMVGDD